MEINLIILFREFSIVCTLIFGVSFNLDGDITSFRFFGLEYATVNSVIFILPPLKWGKFLNERCFLSGVLHPFS